MEIFRSSYEPLKSRLEGPVQFIQVITGPRQVGKTTLANQLCDQFEHPVHFASADKFTTPGPSWISQQWDIARTFLQQSTTVLLVIDEIQKIEQWGEIVKSEWDQDRREKDSIHVILLGSSRMQMQEGLTESMTGRFEQTVLPHWSFAEMKEAFDLTLDQYLYFGGYPGSMVLIEDEHRWKNYIENAFIETTISKDILMLTQVRKPALLKGLFELVSAYSGEILSYNKMLGQLQDAGNTTTLAHYLNLLDQAGLVAGLNKYSPKGVKQRKSSPKLQTYNTALINAQKQQSFSGLKNDPSNWGRLVESAVGAHLINAKMTESIDLYYWRERDKEVDFVIQKGGQIIGLEVKSGDSGSTSGMDAFTKKFNPHKTLLIGRQGIPLKTFFQMSPVQLF